MTNFRSKLNYGELEYYLSNNNERQVENDRVYMLTEKLTQLAYPTYEDQYDKRWEYFYIPIKRNRKTIVAPVWIMEYNKEFFVTIQSFGRLHIKKGDKESINQNTNELVNQLRSESTLLKQNTVQLKTKVTEKFYGKIIEETLRFIPLIKKNEGILQKLIPYDIRTGKIKGYYILEELLSQNRKKTILESYQKHLEKKLEIKEISLNDYMGIAAMCYKAAYQEKTENLSPLEMYKKWGDGRDGGMISIKDWDNKTEFSQWHNSGQHIGSHPFEIVFSWHDHGIHLYPPEDSSPHYGLRVTNYSYARDFLKMLCEMIKKQIPFEVGRLEDVLDFLAGDTYFTVNKMDEHHFMYMQSREYKQKYFPHIEWNDIKIVKWI